MKGAIFDMDGLLFDTEKLYQAGWKEIGKQHGIDMPTELARSFAGASKESVIERLSTTFSIDGQAFFDEVFAYVTKHSLSDLQLKPGVKEILDYFSSQHIKMAVASSSTKDLIARNLKNAQIDSYFMTSVSGQEVECGKPAPDIFLLAAKRMHLDPSACFVFEDAINGVLAGLAAGAQTIMIPDLIPPKEEFYTTTYGVFDSLLVALEAIKKAG